MADLEHEMDLLRRDLAEMRYDIEHRVRDLEQELDLLRRRFGTHTREHGA